jgi:hypothetical protein
MHGHIILDKLSHEMWLYAAIFGQHGISSTISKQTKPTHVCTRVSIFPHASVQCYPVPLVEAAAPPIR